MQLINMHAAVDLGASWIHGINDNPITELCHQAGLHLFNTGETVTMFDGDGAAIDEDLDDRMLAEVRRSKNCMVADDVP